MVRERQGLAALTEREGAGMMTSPGRPDAARAAVHTVQAAIAGPRPSASDPWHGRLAWRLAVEGWVAGVPDVLAATLARARE